MNKDNSKAMILVVDDDPMMLNLIQTNLRREGYQTAGAKNGHETNDWLNNNTADLMLLDYRLPDLDAQEIVELLSEQDILPPFIIITGRGDEHTAVSMMKQGARDYLIKDGALIELLPSVINLTMEQIFNEKKLAQAETQLRELLKKIQNSRDNVLSLLNSLRIGTATTDSNGCITFISELCQPLTGKDANDTIGKKWIEIFPFRNEDKSRLLEIYELPPHHREKLSVNIGGDGDTLYWMDVEIKNDPSESDGRILVFYDMSEVHDLRRQLSEKHHHGELLGKSKAMQLVVQRIQEVSQIDSTVLIEGDTGTGKEIVARSIHSAGHRKNGPFLAMNCGGLSDSLLESQLFGHKRGAFTGAIEDHKGFFEAASGGTLFLDEIGDVPPAVQTRLLRILQEKEVIRLGESKPRDIDVRVLVATQHNLEKEVQEGRFRRDLLYRIRVARIQLATLAERKEDIPILVASFMRQSNATANKDVQNVSHEAMRALLEFNWPGNVRELQNIIEYATIRCKGTVIQTEDLPPEILLNTPEKTFSDEISSFNEKDRLLVALDKASGNRSKAAKMLGMSRATFYRHMTRLGIPTTK
jgi:sigma-54 dependent transcriptional regulator, acetoin dehydrogenase operon transcriptional activator AcoR